jgi:uncharacterized protein YdeI (YjbR/CyaY-like superfamily)
MSGKENDMDTFYPASKQQWREWLQKHHQTKQSVWLICYKKASGMPTLSWSDAVDEALCFGWIDSTRRPIDGENFMQFFGKRKSNGTWSKINKEKVQRLAAEGLMAKAGIKSIEEAKQNGSWTILDDVEELIIPDDLEAEFSKLIGSKDFFLSLSKSVKKQILYRVVAAKRPETRQKRITEIAELAAQKLKPKLF